jgi:hypothetical protein
MTRVGSLPQNAQTGFGAHFASHSKDTGVLSREKKRPGREASYSPPSSTQVRNNSFYNVVAHEQIYVAPLAYPWEFPVWILHPASCYCQRSWFFWGGGSPQCSRASSFTRFLDHTQRHTAVGGTIPNEWSAWRRDLYLTTHNTHNRQTDMSPVRFEPTISAGERPQNYALDRAATGTVSEADRPSLFLNPRWKQN